MQETIQQRETAMRDVLKKIQNEIDLQTFTFEEQRIAKECFDAGFFEGVVMLEMISGRIVAEYRHKPRLTHNGMQFLYAGSQPDLTKVEVSFSESEHELQENKQHNDRTEEEANRKKDRKAQFIGAIIIALLTLFLEHIGQILSIIIKFLHQ